MVGRQVTSSWWANRLPGRPSEPPGGAQPPGQGFTQAGPVPGYTQAQVQPQIDGGQVASQLSASQMMEAYRAGQIQTQGGDGVRAGETESCPSCRSPNFFRRDHTEGGMLRRGPAPAPHCMDCGYPLVQAGSGLGGSGIAPTGPARMAQQRPADMTPFGVMNTDGSIRQGGQYAR